MMVNSQNFELGTPQQAILNTATISSELEKAMGSHKTLSPEKWICTNLSQFSQLDIIQEYLEGIAAAAELSTDGLPAMDVTPKSTIAFDDNVDQPHLGNPVPRPV